MNWQQYCYTVNADLHRLDKPRFWWHILFTPEFRYIFYLRSIVFLKANIILSPLSIPLRIVFKRMQIKYGLNIPYTTQIGPGLFIGHHGGIVVNQKVIIGKNCNINHQVTIGIAYGGRHPGTPVIGNNVFLGAGCKIFGGITIEDNVAVGANCVVTKSFATNAVLGGIPGKILSYKGSKDYVVNRCGD